ncbi:MBL fold metallo-hydrolase [Rhodococcus sp. USK10]|uniref:MBL fold metallo-hydrolase n=1 Tax=Rhodococcus sp. USK10 TaxID=2789739 RepID=UPI001C5D16D0|nr:MBL fold metallo-hydrolase [Rhodococcus sp. USK10]QYB07370.1 MBL fold metallo-hydrolase [Rhodococcus sp. USK10]
MSMKPGLHRLELPLAGHSIDHVNVYLLEAGGRLLIIDCGWSTPEARAHLEQFVAHLGYRLDDIDTLLLTHLHADHAGLAGWMQSWGVSVGLHPADAVQLEDRFHLPQPHHDETAAWLAWAGVPESLWHRAQQQVSEQAALFWPGVPDISLREGSVIRHGPFHLTVIHTPGHTPGSVSFYESSTRSLFSGDTLFSRSTYSPTLRPGSSEDPMSEYLNSLQRLRNFDVEWVLPGHHSPFTGLATRIDTVASHHRSRADHIARAIPSEGATVWEVAAGLPRRRDWSSLPVAAQLSATGEAGAHLTRLSRNDLLEERTGPPTIWLPGGP